MHLIAIALVAGLSAPASPQERSHTAITPDRKLAIKVSVNGEFLTFDAEPIMVASRVLVPMRGVFEKLGASVGWDKPARKVTATSGPSTIELRIGQNRALIDGKPHPLDQPAVLYHGRTMVPLRFVSEALGAKVDWLTADRTVQIEKPPRG